MEKVDVTVIGAGVVGLAIARSLAQHFKDVLILEQEGRIGAGISSRNSEVIHAGIYYASDSLKAQLCVKGKHQLYDYCQSHRVGHKRIGKLIVAQHDNDKAALDTLLTQAERNGVDDLQWWEAAEISAKEPHVKASLALFSPSTGIVDSHGLMESLLADAQQHQAQLVLHTGVTRITPQNTGFDVDMLSAQTPYQCHSRIVINATGLQAQQVAHSIEGYDTSSIPLLYYAKGNYFHYSGRSPFNHLIYPLPEAKHSGLGIHATLDLAGQLRFGPDVRYIDDIDYQVDAYRLDAFQQAIQTYFPGLDPAKLAPDYVGIRPKLQAPGAASEDFCLHSAVQHQLPGLINLFGIESPGLTSCLALAEMVTKTVLDEIQ